MNAADYARALAMLESIAGVDVIKLISPERSTCLGKSWTLRTRGNLEVAICDLSSGLCECFLLPGHVSAGTITIATVQLVRVLCGKCRWPKVLRWPVSSGDSYTCSDCRTQNFVTLH
jgi:hypothetical protein